MSNKNNSKGKFIVLEGIDGSGKGALARLLGDYIFELSKEEHVHFILTREPFISQYYKEIRRILKESKNAGDNSETLLKLFSGDRKIHEEIISYLKERGIHTITDRWKYSTEVYQESQGIPIEKILHMHKNGLIPDLAFIIDTPADIALERISKDINREYTKMFEVLDFQKKLRSKYLMMPTLHPNENVQVINGNMPIGYVFHAMKGPLDKLFLNKPN